MENYDHFKKYFYEIYQQINHSEINLNHFIEIILNKYNIYDHKLSIYDNYHKIYIFSFDPYLGFDFHCHIVHSINNFQNSLLYHFMTNQTRNKMISESIIINNLEEKYLSSFIVTNLPIQSIT